jgi:hypothetical protein
MKGMSDMTRMLLAAAACVAALGAGTVSAQAQMFAGYHGTPSAGSGFTRVEVGHDGRFGRGGFDNCFSSRDVRFSESGEGRHHGDGDGRHRGDRCGDGFIDYYGGEWALYNNRSFDSDSYNGWWHDRPDRAYPAWMRRNQDCQRPWFSGDTLTC